MYKYEWDEETGGLILLPELEKMSLEPRPVYYRELDILGFDKYWNYPKDDSAPLLWATANNYIYRGRLVAKTKGGALYTPPELELIEEPEPDGQPLRPVDIKGMVEKNADLLETLEQETIQGIYNTFVKYKNKVDVFYVAFSGGKDSIVTLDLVQKALPHNEFMVLFGDTGMEFPDTYETIKQVKAICEKAEIDFHVSKSELDTLASWKLFGPPATVSRWCCSVHKTAPQILLLRKLLNKIKFKGMAYVGVRGSESLARSKYDYISYGGKHQGQYSCNAILEWNSAEIFLHIFKYNLVLNEAYKKGNRRAGCLICPRAAERNDFMNHFCYKDHAEKFVQIIRDSYSESFASNELLEDFIRKGGWKARKNGRDISNHINYKEKIESKGTWLLIENPHDDWKEWIKTVGTLTHDEDSGFYTVNYNNQLYNILIEERNDGYALHIDKETAIKHPEFIKILKQVFRRAACCVQCHECEANCPNGCISFDKGKVQISENCTHCLQCYSIEKGCLRYKSLELPKGGLIMAGKSVSLNTYSHHAPKMEWIKQYFSYKNDFDENHSLGSQMYNFFKRFLRDAKLLDKDGFSQTAEIIDKMGLEKPQAWGIMLVNICYAPQVNWFVKTFDFGQTYTKQYISSSLINVGAKENWTGDIISSLGRLMELPFGEIGLGEIQKSGRTISSVTRHRWSMPDATVILYSLYKFAEACGGIYQFSLATLLDDEIEREGVSPTRIFGLDKETMMPLLNGLSANYPEFISVSFTLGMDSITLRSEKKAEDVLTLF